MIGYKYMLAFDESQYLFDEIILVRFL